MNGSIDRVERAADGSVVIVDLKTGSRDHRGRTTIDAHPQLGAYQLAYAEGVLDEFLDELGEHHSGGAKLLYVKKGMRGKLLPRGRARRRSTTSSSRGSASASGRRRRAWRRPRSTASLELDALEFVRRGERAAAPGAGGVSSD